MRTRAVRVRQKRGGAGGFRIAVPAAISCAVLLALALAQMLLAQVLLVARVGHEGGSGGDDGFGSIGVKRKNLREKNGANEEHRMGMEPVRAGGADSGGGQRVKDEADTSWSLVGEVASLWRGSAPMPTGMEWMASDADPDDDDANVTLVLTHCDMDLHWLQKYASGVRVRRLVVLSKCGQDLRAHGRAVRAGDLLPDVDDCALERLPNVGRCDHAIADYMDRIASSSVPPSRDSEIVVFLKDSLDAQRSRMETRSLREGIRIARSRGFGCLRPPGSARSDALSSLHLTEEMARLFKKREYHGLVRSDNDNAAFASRYENMAAWLRDLGLTLPRPYTPVCYGGMFAVTMERIRSVPRGRFAAIRDSLARGDNVEEGHYAERTWEGLLAIPIRQDLARLTAAALATHVYVEAEDGDNWRLGALARDCRGHYKLPLKDAGNWARCPATLHELAGQH